MLPAMKRAALALVLAACSASSNDFPPLPEGGPPGGNAAGGGGTVRDGGIDGATDGGVLISGRVCVVRDLSNPTDCDPNADASRVTVVLGTRRPTVGPDRTGAFLIAAPAGSPVWRATGRTFVSSVMPFGTETTIPIVPDTLYTDVLNASGATILPAGQGSVLARVVSGVSPAANVQAATTLTSNSITAVPLYATRNGLVWTTTGPTLASGTVWFPGVDVTAAPARITFQPQGSAGVSSQVNVEEQAITFITQDIQ
jgi:hypothetical protein